MLSFYNLNHIYLLGCQGIAKYVFHLSMCKGFTVISVISPEMKLLMKEYSFDYQLIFFANSIYVHPKLLTHEYKVVLSTQIYNHNDIILNKVELSSNAMLE